MRLYPCLLATILVRLSTLSEPWTTVVVASEPRQFSGHTDAVYSVVFSPDSRTLASGSYDQTLRLWDVESGRVTHSLTGHEDQIYRLAFSPDGQRLASCSADGTIRVWQVGAEGAPQDPSSANLSPASRARRTRSAIDTGAEMHCLKGHDAPVLSLAFSPDGRRIASVGYDKTARLWDANSGQLLREIRHEQPVSAVAFDRDEDCLATGEVDGTIRLWDAATGKEIRRLFGASAIVYQLSFAPEKHHWLVAALGDGTLGLWNPSRSQPDHLIKADASALFTASFSADGSQLATGGRDRVIRLWSVPQLDEPRLLEGTNETVLSVAFSPDGKYLAAGCYDATIHLWTLSAAGK